MELFLLIAITHFMALLSPGPDFFLILTSLLKKGNRAAQYVCVGISIGNAIILILIFLMSIFLDQSDVDFYLYLKWAGATYLLYLAYQCFGSAKDSTKAFEIGYVSNDQTRHSKFKNIILGVQSSLLNPKNILFYSSLLLLINQQYGLFEKMLLSIWMVAVVLFWNLLIVRLLSGQRLLIWLKHQSFILYRMSGVFFSIFAILLIIL